jgi:hypothetical protein
VQSVTEDVVIYTGIAVAVTTDPTTQSDQGGNSEAGTGPIGFEEILELAIQSRQLF